MKFSRNAQIILEKRYLKKDKKGNIIETPEELFRRVALNIAQVDSLYDNSSNIESTFEEFYQILSHMEFLPNSPTLMNAGTPINQLAACFVLPVEDSILSIFDSLKKAALIHKSGGGVGFSFSKLRPHGDIVQSTSGIASGPVSFMKIFNEATDVIKQGGKRRGANMGILNVNHPDIIEFIKCKESNDSLNNFNLSVSVNNEFMDAVKKDNLYNLINPRNSEIVKKIPAPEIFDLIVEMAWKTGDPGIIFIDEINKRNPTPLLGKIEATNPCGEQPLLNYESCNLGSINLTKIVKNSKIDWNKLKKTIRTSMHFLDNVIDANNYPLKEIETITKKNRKIGLGVMGFAEMLIMLKIPYNSQKALETADGLMQYISKEGQSYCEELGEKRGSFPSFKDSVWYKSGFSAMRNATITTIAPTGSISIIANVTSGIEPLFAITYTKQVLDGENLFESNKLFEKIAKDEGFYNLELEKKIIERGGIQNIEEISQNIKELFITAHEIDALWHVKMQAVFQKNVDNGVSKTVNLPEEATLKDVKKTFLMAHELHCKGITVYRYRSKDNQVLYTGKNYLNPDVCPNRACPH